ncbi:MAG: hypothetical protein RLZZ444_2059, partial [Pseudomonadota bacterium]
MPSTIYDRDLDRNDANFAQLTPLTFLERAADVFPDRVAIIHGSHRETYRELRLRSRRLASALAARGVARGDTVAVMLANTPAMIECHYGVPLTGGVLNTLNTRLDAATLAFILDHGEAKVLITDREFAPAIREALSLCTVKPLVIDYDDPVYPQTGERLGTLDYEALLAEGRQDHPYRGPDDEWDAISLNYTSGTTSNPKGVVYHHRGAHLLAQGNILTSGMPNGAVYLWTLPMFHCNGWCFPWSLSVVGGTHVCLRQVRASAIYEAIEMHGVTHMCGAPIVMSIILNASSEEKRAIDRQITFMTAAAPPPEAVLAAMKQAGFDVIHLYGLTETYGPAVVNEWQGEWDALDQSAWAQKKSRQGVRYSALDRL